MTVSPGRARPIGPARPRPRPRRAAIASLLAFSGFAAAGSAAAQTAGPPIAGSDPEAVRVLEAAAERYGTLDAFCADFRQVVENEILRQTTRSRGELCQAGRDRFEMRFSDPAGDRVVADGEYVWAYFPSADPGQVFRGDPAEAGGRFDLHEEFLRDPGTRYAAVLEATEAVDGHDTHRIFLRPRGASPFLRARLWIDAGTHLIRRAEFVEDEGFTRTLDLTAFRLNPEIPPERFEFELPSGVQVISR